MIKIFPILLLGFFLRIIFISYPPFSIEEARFAFRGERLVTEKKDELGRTLPFVFNSLSDYQLPVTPYLTGLGILVFGKTDLGARISFIVLGTLIILLTYLVAKRLFNNEDLSLFSAATISVSPPLIYLSRIPNETIPLLFFTLLLIYLFFLKGWSIFLIFVALTLAFLTSKFAWFIEIPIMVILILREKPSKLKIALATISLVSLIALIFLYYKIPQSDRSISENVFPLFNEITVLNAINRLRGQGIEQGMPVFFESLLFNKLSFLVVGIVNFLKHLSPALIFGYFDQTGIFNFSFSGLLPKILIIPLIIGLVDLIKSKEKYLFLLPTLVVFLFPAIFFYNQIIHPLLIMSLPVLSIVIAFGLKRLNRSFQILVFFMIVFEIMLIFFINKSAEIKNTNLVRPIWVEAVVKDINKNMDQRIYLSDNLTQDPIPFLGWYGYFSLDNEYSNIIFPYKFHQTMIGNVTLIASEAEFKGCIDKKNSYLYLSQRDSLKIKEMLNSEKLKVDENKKILGVEGKIFYDSLQNPQIYLIKDSICIK